MKQKQINGFTWTETHESELICLDHPCGILTLTAEPEEMDATDYWWKETDCFTSRQQAKRFSEKSLNPFWFCSIKLTLHDVEDLESEESEYLGCCNYKDGFDFIEDNSYFSDMLEELTQSKS